MSSELQAARRLREKNPNVWATWVAAAEDAAAHERRFSVQLVTEQTRAHDYVDNDGQPFKLNNNMRAAWARMLASEYPQVRPYIELRRSKFDADFPELFGGDSRG